MGFMHTLIIFFLHGIILVFLYIPGDLFDIRDFHSVILVNGGMPLNLLEQLVDDWIAATLHPENALQDKDEKICTEE